MLGGAERQRILLANELVARGHPVSVVCLKELGRYVTELDPRVRLSLQPFWQPVVDATDLPEIRTAVHDRFDRAQTATCD